ncbi:MAG: hypothetical protein ACK56I_14395, partial [bacterium]
DRIVWVRRKSATSSLGRANRAVVVATGKVIRAEAIDFLGKGKAVAHGRVQVLGSPPTNTHRLWLSWPFYLFRDLAAPAGLLQLGRRNQQRLAQATVFLLCRDVLV